MVEKYVPEPTPLGLEPVLSEWLTRELRRIEEQFALVARTRVLAGYAGLYLGTPQSGVNFTLGAGWRRLTDCDTTMYTVPLQAEQDLVNGALRLMYPGVWQLGLVYTMEHASNAADRRPYARLVEQVSGTPWSIPHQVFVGRDEEGHSYSLVEQVVLTKAQTGTRFAWELGGGEAFSGCDFIDLQFYAVHIGPSIPQ